MTILANVTITGAVTAATSTPLQLRAARGALYPTCVTIQANFTYGSGGTTAAAWLQTSFDGGGTWCDVAKFSYTTSSARSVINLNSSTSVTTAVTPTDGTGTTIIDGMIGSLWRVKYTTTGTYAGSTTLRIDAISNGFTAQ